MKLLDNLLQAVVDQVEGVSGKRIEADTLILSPTKKEFSGDFTLLVFPLTRYFGKSPEITGELVGKMLTESLDWVVGYNVIKGFLNLDVSDGFWSSVMDEIHETPEFGVGPRRKEKVVVEFSSPNTNKPLHLGHIRNILLGWSVANILEAAGFEIVRTQIINDRGIAVCKSMLAWQKFGEGETPGSTGVKGDHLVGKYYVIFEQKFREEYTAWQHSAEGKTLFREQGGDQDESSFFSAYKNDYFNVYSALGKEARDMLLRWEAGDGPTVALWKQMNEWVYQGFDTTYRDLGVGFDHNYYESDTFTKGKAIVEEGLDKGLFYKESDGSIWVDLTDAKMDKKILLRSDGTALYITQDLGTAEQRYRDHQATRMVYVVGDEQDYHFKVLFEIMKRLERPYADGLYHLSYGMVDLPSGRMKSREGTVVDADDLMQEVIEEAWKSARARAEEFGKELLVDETDVRKIALAALKFYIIKVHPQKRMVFNPEESLDMQGQTGPYVQNAYVRIQSIFRKLEKPMVLDGSVAVGTIHDYEKQLIATLMDYPATVAQAAAEYQPSHIANYCYDLAKKFHKYYAEVQVLREEDPVIRQFRLKIIHNVGKVLERGMLLLGIEMVERM